MISVVIPTLGRPSLLQNALQSVANQTCQDYEVIIVNDGGASLKSLARTWQERFPLTLIELPERSGAAGVRNAGIERAEGSYIAFLDDDDIFLPQHLGTARQALSEGAEFVYLAAVVSDRRVTCLPPAWASLHRKDYAFDERFLLVANFIHTGSVVTKNFRGTTQRFDESLTHCEDWDLWIALTCELGYRVAFVDELTSIYQQVAGSRGLVSQGQLTSPSPFSVVREKIYRRWPTSDEQVREYRKWFVAFEDYRNECITAGRVLPTQLFDSVLRYTYTQFANERAVDFSRIPSFFGPQRQLAAGP